MKFVAGSGYREKLVDVLQALLRRSTQRRTLQHQLDEWIGGRKGECAAVVDTGARAIPGNMTNTLAD